MCTFSRSDEYWQPRKFLTTLRPLTDNFFGGWPQHKILMKSAKHQSSICNENCQTALFQTSAKFEKQKILEDK